VTATEDQFGKIKAEWIVPDKPPDDKLLLYIHGGGFISGSCSTHRTHVAKFAIESRVKALVFDYRLAPEHPFPAALDDCIVVYEGLLNRGYKPENIVVGGESAGATLTLSLLLALKEKSIVLPKAAFVISPVTDLRCEGASFYYNAHKDIAPFNSWKVWTNYYIGKHDPTDPLLSPLFGNFKGIPPLFICVGTNEIHLEDCIALARVTKDHGVDTTIRIWNHMVHAFPILSPWFPEAKRALKEICDFTSIKLTKQ
jgi:acetyl esterase/lipase